MDKEFVYAKLNKLYGEKSSAMLNRIEQVIVNSNLQKLDKKILSEKDVYLITYADSIKKDNAFPLNTLNNFSKKYLKGIISDIHLLPFYPYSSDDGFSVIDYKKVKEDFGDWSDVKNLSANFRLMFDGVFNHISAQSEWFQEYLKGNTKYKNYFVEVDPNDERLSLVKRPRALPLLTKFNDKHIWTTFSEDQIDVNIRESEVFFAILDVLLFYIANGAKTIRLDAIGYLWKELGTNCFSIEQTHDVLKIYRAIISEIFPSVLLLSEVNDTHANNVGYFGNGSDEMHMVYQFTLSTLLVHTIQTGNCEKLAEWARGVTDIPKGEITFFNLLASHDGIGVVPARGILTEDEITAMADRTLERGGKVSYKSTPGGEVPYELNINYYNALSDAYDNEKLKIKRFMCAQFTLLSFMGVPAIYVHSLLGSENDVDGMKRTGQNRSINREKLDVEKLENELSDKDSLRYKIFNSIKELIEIRKQHGAFSPFATQEIIDIEDNRVLGLCRTAKSGEKIIALVNYSSDEVIFDLPKEYQVHGRDLILENNIDLHAKLKVLPYGYRWIKLY